MNSFRKTSELQKIVSTNVASNNAASNNAGSTIASSTIAGSANAGSANASSTIAGSANVASNNAISSEKDKPVKALTRTRFKLQRRKNKIVCNSEFIISDEEEDYTSDGNLNDNYDISITPNSSPENEKKSGFTIKLTGKGYDLKFTLNN